MGGVVIVGASQAGFQVAASLRELGYQDAITLIGDEPELPYQRPPLSKAFLKGEAGEHVLQLRPPAFFDKQRIDLITGTRVARLEPAARRIELSNGASVAFRHLVLATGARNRRLNVAGADLPGVFYLRDRAEAGALKDSLASAQNIVVIGAGFIGLEVASVARSLGKNVVVLEAEQRVMARAVSRAISAHFEGLHARAGTEVLKGVTATRIAGDDGRAIGVETSASARIPADLVVIGIGVVPNVELAAEAGLRLADGIVVDSTLATADPSIFAIGDCAAFRDVVDAGLVRLESVQNAIDQAKCVAANIAQAPRPYRATPWFWSDQAATRLQIAGYARVSDLDVTRGEPDAGKFSVFRYLDGRLRAVESVNAAQDHLAARRLIAAGVALSPQAAADPAVDLRALAKAVGPDRPS